MVIFSRKKQVIYDPRVVSCGWPSHTWLPDAAPAGSGRPCPGKIWQAHSGSAWSAPKLGADPCSCDHLEQEKALEKGERTNTNHFTTCLLGFVMTCCFVVQHVVFTNLANASVGSIRRPRQDRLFLSLIEHRSPDDWSCLQNDKKQTFRVGSDLDSHLAQPRGLCLCYLHICRWLFSFGLHTHTNVCERALNTFWGSRANLWRIWPSYIKSYLSALTLPTLQSFSYVSALQVLKTSPLASLKSFLFQGKCLSPIFQWFFK